MLFGSSRAGRPRLCRGCGSLIGADSDTCTYCGAKDRLTTGLARNPAAIFGAIGPARAIAFFIAAYFLIMVGVDRLLGETGQSIDLPFEIGGGVYGTGTFV